MTKQEQIDIFGYTMENFSVYELFDSFLTTVPYPHTLNEWEVIL